MKALLAFEAVMRLGSMTAAARELGSTQPAVSQRIRALEETVGVPLFERQGSRLRPTTAGNRYCADIKAAVRSLSSATRRLQADALAQKPELTIAAHFGVVHLWLLPLLPRLESAFPAVRFEVVSVDQDDAPEMDAADLTIRFGEFDALRQGNYLLFKETVYPVCTPAFAARHGLTNKLTATQMQTLPLLHMDHRDPRWLDWYRWADRTHLPRPSSPPRFTYNNYPLLLDAATKSEGVALGWDALAGPLIRKSALVPLQPVTRRNNHGYLLCTRHPELASVARVINWLIHAGAQ